MKKITKPLIFVLMAFLVCTLLAVPLAVSAREWWIMEVTYTVQGRMPESITGPRSRIYMPEITAVLSDGIEMDVNYEIVKDGDVLASGALSEETFFDLNGSGSYTFKYQGVDASNSYSFEIVAKDSEPSIILDSKFEMNAYTDDVFCLPSATIIYNGTEKAAQVKMITAGGEQYLPDQKVIPESGSLFVIYYAEIDGVEYSFDYELNVIDRGIGFYDDAGTFYPAGQLAHSYSDMKGCILNDPTMLTYTFSEIIDLSAASKDIPLIVLNNASTTGKTTPKVKIVDVYDPQNYIEIIGRWSADNDTMVYSVARTPNQQLGGVLDGAFYTQEVFGALTTFPTSATAGIKKPATYYFDASEKALYVDWYGRTDVLNDLDAEYHMFPWDGFTTGEVYIVVERQSNTDFICVESVAGYSLSSLDMDTVPPKIEVAAEGISNIPAGVVGVEYPVFAAKAYDLMDSTVDVSVRVYKGYDASNGIELPIWNNAFMPYEEGYYTIVYSAKDRYDNRTELRLGVLVRSKADSPDIEAVIQAPVTEAFVGERIKVYAPESISGGSGKVGYQVYMIGADGSENEIVGNEAAIPAEGVNVLRYVFKDYLGITKEYSYEIRATVSQNPILHDLVMPNVVCSGKKLILPAASYVDTGDVKVTVEATLNGRILEVVDGTVTPVAEKMGDVLTVTYKAVSATGSSEKSYSIAVLRGDTSDRTTYFIPEQGNITVTQGKESIRFTTQESMSSVRFANAVLSDKVKLSFSVDPEQNDADMITVRFIDSMDPNISVKLDIVKQKNGNDKGTSDLYINGNRTNSMAGNFYGGTEALQLSFNAKSLGITDALGAAVGSITRTEDGKAFTGFPSGEVNIIISVGTVGEKGFSFDLLQINNQNFYDDEMFFDTYAEMILSDDVKLQVDLGAEMEIPAAVVGDVLSPSASVTVSVRKGNEVVLDKRSAAEPILFAFDEYGVYKVIYNYSDGVNSRSASYTVRTVEYTPPRVDDSINLPKEAKTGDVISVVMPGVSDESAENVTVSVIIRTPTSTMYRLAEEQMSFVVDKVGNYTVMYYIYDECFNYQIITREIAVTEQSE